ncbi:MAG: ATP-binding protein [Chitinispirillia bacterium]|jgi:signal transduction histidine kinase
MMFLKNLELEWKILIMALIVFIAFAWPVQTFFIARLNNTLLQSIDPELDPILREQLKSTSGDEHESVIASLKRSRQWKAMIPIIVKEQQRTILSFSFGFFMLLFITALWTLKRLTKPLKNLALVVDNIGRGNKVNIESKSGGALGTVEKAVVALSEELEILREKERIQGMETAWRDIARVMAHEIKNPLTPIRLTIDRMEEKVFDEETIPINELSKFLNRINTQVDTLERLVNQFRSFSREPEVNLKEISLYELLEDIAEDMKSKMKTNISCSDTIITDPYLLNQILLNIWKNSLEAGADTIEVKCKKDKAKIDLYINDNGSGLDKKDIEKVWLPYFTLKKGGTGLGLPVVKKLVETLNGTVSLISKTVGPHKGLTVILSFNIATQGEQKWQEK